MGRATQGVRLINLKEDDAIASIARVDSEQNEETITGDVDGFNISGLDDTDDQNEINPDDFASDQEGDSEE
jgi:DNA gyrase subunit A